MAARHWYVVKKLNVETSSIKVGDVLGFKNQNPNLSTLTDGHFIPTAEWIYIGKWETPPIDDLQEALDLIRVGGGKDDLYIRK